MYREGSGGWGGRCSKKRVVVLCGESGKSLTVMHILEWVTGD